MSISEYQEQYWGRLREALDKMFDYPPGTYKPISYEEVSHVVPTTIHLTWHIQAIFYEDWRG